MHFVKDLKRNIPCNEILTILGNSTPRNVYLHGGIFGKWSMAMCKLKRSYSKRPYISSVTMEKLLALKPSSYKKE
jgi:hypothetical protein